MRSAALASLGKARNPALIKRTIDLIEKVDDNEISALIHGLISHHEGMEAAVDWITQNCIELSNRLGSHLLTLCFTIFGNFHSSSGVERAKELFAKVKGARTEPLVLESIEGRRAWIERGRKDVQEWVQAYLAKHSPNLATVSSI